MLPAVRPGQRLSAAGTATVSCRVMRVAERAAASQRAVARQALPGVSPIMDLAEGLDTPAQLIYLTSLLGMLSVGAYFAVRQVLVRRELDESSKQLGERVRTGEATYEDYYELGSILMRKRLFTQGIKNIQKAVKTWEGDDVGLAQAHNALGFAFFSLQRYKEAIEEYKRAVELSPGYTVAWNNLGDAHEARKDWDAALQAYQASLAVDPNNGVAKSRSEAMKTRLSRLDPREGGFSA